MNDDIIDMDFRENTWVLELSEDLLKPYRIFSIIQNGHSKMVYSSGLKRGTERDFIATQTEQEKIFCFTKNEKNTWFAVDFGQTKAIIPGACNFHYSDNTTFTCPRNWLLQGYNKPNA